MKVLFTSLLLALFQLACVNAKNMNDGDYLVANAMDPSYKTEWEAEYFDAYSKPIRSRYSEVFWSGFNNLPIPDDVVQRFANKTMAIIGYEVDQVRVDENGNEVSVPITHAYNHHYIAWLQDSRKGSIVKKQLTEEQLHSHQHGMMTHGTNEYWDFEFLNEEVQNTYEDGAAYSPSQIFSEANGGEMRLSYHGYPQGYAQLIHSPDSFGIQPMQIDTWNRDEPSPRFKPGPLPRNSPQRGNPDAIYSGLLECPCSDRLDKWWQVKYKLQDARQDVHQCTAKGVIANATECFHGANYVIPIAKQVEHYQLTGDTTKPSGCSLNQNDKGVLQVYWNEPAALSDIVEEELNQANSKTVMAFATGAINATVELESGTAAQATITMVGPANVWFGMGFGALSMCRHMEADECQGGGPYAIIVYEDHIEERKLGFHAPGDVLPTTLTIVENRVSPDGLNRTVVLKRALEVDDDRYFSFDSKEPTLDVILARGCSMPFAQHCGHGSATMNFLAVDTPMRVCLDGIDGKIDGGGFRDDRCAPFPLSTLQVTKNPTCSIETYKGGLSCCRHGKSLLDKDQEIPWPDQVLEYRMKFRYYFEEYTHATAIKPASHKPMVRFYWTTEAHAGEYDITPCPPGTPPSQCIQVITSQWKVRDMIGLDRPWSQAWGAGPNSSKAKGINLIYAGPHCHAPSCLSIELYNADTGDLLCHVEPKAGTSKDKIFDEEGFLAIPPCLWSDNPVDGLMAPILLPLDTTLLSIKRNNNTVGHTGEMASWQMRGIMVGVPDEKERAEEVNDKAKTEAKADVVSDTAEAKKTSVRRGRPEV